MNAYNNYDNRDYNNGYSYGYTPNFTLGDAYTQPYATPTQPVKKKKKRSLNTIGVLLLSAVIAFGAGFGGATLANRLSDPVVVTRTEVVSGGSQAVNTSSSVAVAQAISPSVVSIVTEQMQMNMFWYGARVVSGAGSGVILSEDGYILTCAHVVDGASAITVTTSDGQEYAAEIVGGDSDEDIAVIKIEATGLTPAVIGNSDAVAQGEHVYAVGNPGGALSGTITDGIISAVDRTITLQKESSSSSYYDWGYQATPTISLNVLQTNAAVSPGSSGGGLFDDAGALIGIINAKSSGSGQEGLGFAIPINHAIEIASRVVNLT